MKGTKANDQQLGRAIQEFRDLISNFHIENRRYDIHWRWNKRHGFTDKSLYEILNDWRVIDALLTKIWSLYLPPESKDLHLAST